MQELTTDEIRELLRFPPEQHDHDRLYGCEILKTTRNFAIIRLRSPGNDSGGTYPIDQLTVVYLPARSMGTIIKLERMRKVDFTVHNATEDEGRLSVTASAYYMNNAGDNTYDYKKEFVMVLTPRLAR